MLFHDNLYSAPILKIIREPLIVVDNNFCIKHVNAAYYSYFNAKEQDTKGNSLFDIADGQWQNHNLKQQLYNVKTSASSVEDFEFEVQLPELGQRLLSLNLYPIFDIVANEQYILITMYDVTPIRTETSLLEKKIVALEKNIKELSSFNYIVSHDLQEPLRKINTFSKMILDDDESDLSVDSSEHLSRILVSTRRMQQLIEDLLNYSDIGNKDTYQLFDTDLNKILKESLEELSAPIIATGATITATPLPLLRAVPFLLRQLFINLIGNAIKYTAVNTAPIISIESITVNANEVPILRDNAPAVYYKIMVKDNGIGFPNSQSQKIFDPFHRLHSKDKYDGTGIGLAICSKIMAKHQGLITAESSPDNGAVFTLYFPT